MTPKRRPTIQDVARLAGVSPATASRVINGNTKVDRAAHDRVMKAIGELDYHVDAVARFMSQGSTKLLGFIMEDLHNPFNAESLELAMSQAEKQGYQVIVALSGTNGKHMEKAVRFLMQARVEGILVSSASIKEPSLMKLIKKDFPVVLFNRHLEPSETSFVGPDYRTGQRLATDHVINLGHRRIALITGSEQLSSVRERLLGFYDAVNQAHLDKELLTVIHTEYKTGSGNSILHRLLTSNNPPTAILTLDFMAIEILGESTRIGVSVPEDLTIVGMDNVVFSSHPNITLTTVDTHIHRQAEMAIGKLLSMVSAGDRDYSNIILPVELIVRKTSGAVKTHERGYKTI